MERRGPRLLRWLAVVVVAVLLAACSSTPKAALSTSPTASSQHSPTSETSTPPTTYPHTWTIDSIDSNEATWATTVAIAQNVISGKALTEYLALHGNTCGLDPATDAIVPFQITTTSTTSGTFTASGDQELKIVNASLGVAPDGSGSPKSARGTQSKAGFASGEALKAAETSSDGPTCSSLDPPSETMTFDNNSLKKGQEVVLKGYFDLKHWASAHQNGDTSWVPNIWILVPNSGIDQTGNGWETTLVSGPAVVNLLDYTPIPTYNPSDSYGSTNAGYGWVFPIDGKSQPDCAGASSNSPRGSSMPSIQSLCEALPEEIVMGYLSNHKEITNAIGRSLTGITSENSMTDVFHSLRDKGEIEMVPGSSGIASAWRKKAPE
jgi:hypothetical protein